MRQLFASILFQCSKHVGTEVFIPHEKLVSLFDLVPSNALPDAAHEAPHRIGTNQYGDLKPEVKEWIGEHWPSSFQRLNHGHHPEDLARVLMYHLNNGAPPYSVRFYHKADAALFRLTWL